MSNTTVVPSTAGPGPSGGPGGGGGGGTEVIQVTNVSPSASSEQMRTLFGFLGKIDELRLFPPEWVAPSMRSAPPGGRAWPRGAAGGGVSRGPELRGGPAAEAARLGGPWGSGDAGASPRERFPEAGADVVDVWALKARHTALYVFWRRSVLSLKNQVFEFFEK